MYKRLNSQTSWRQLQPFNRTGEAGLAVKRKILPKFQPVWPWSPAFDWPPTLWFTGLYWRNQVWSKPYGLRADAGDPRHRSYPGPQLYVLWYLQSWVIWKFSGAEAAFGVKLLEELFDLLMRKLTWVWKHCWAKQCVPGRGFFSVWPSWMGPPPISVLLVFAQQVGWLLACGPLLPPPPLPWPGPSSHCRRKTRSKSVSVVFRRR